MELSSTAALHPAMLWSSESESGAISLGWSQSGAVSCCIDSIGAVLQAVPPLAVNLFMLTEWLNSSPSTTSPPFCTSASD